MSEKVLSLANGFALIDSIFYFAYNAAMADKKKNTGLVAASWFLFVIVLLIIFFVKKDTILTNLKKTDFFGRVFGSTPEFVKNHEIKQPDVSADKKSSGDFEIELLPPQEKKPDTGFENPELPVKQLSADTENGTDGKEQPRDLTPAEKPPVQKSESPKTEEIKPVRPKPVPASRDAALCFIVVDSDGTISRRIVKRSLAKSDSPMTDAINALLAGPLPPEQAKDCMTLIPAGTKLLGASVKDGVATLNFNENFEFNSVGVEGYIAQLMQIVYTATEFPTVKSVQFLIEGKRKDYLGSEGQWIGSPLSRSTF